MNILVTFNLDTTMFNSFLYKIKDYKSIDKIIAINYMLSNKEKENILKSNKIISVDCDINQGYSYMLNLALKYISKHYKNSNIVVCNPNTEFSDEVVNNLIKKVQAKDIGVITPVINSCFSEIRGNKLLSAKNQLKARLPFLNSREMKKPDNIFFYPNDHYNSDISYVDYTSMIFFVTKEEVMRKIEYLDEEVFFAFEEEILATKLKNNNYKWAISNTDRVEASTCYIIDWKKDFDKIRLLELKDRKHYFKHYLIKTTKDKLLLGLIPFFRILKKILYTVLSFIRLIKRVVNIFWNAIKKAWTVYHFLMPFKVLKEDFSNFLTRLKIIPYNCYFDKEYTKWIKTKEKEPKFNEFLEKPLLNLILCLSDIEVEDTKRCINSILNQTYDNFNLHIIENNITKEKHKLIEEYAKMDQRIKVTCNKKEKSEALLINDVVKNLKQDYLVFLEEFHILDKNALAYFVDTINNNKVDFIYGDEDKINNLNVRNTPIFKPGFSPDTLLSFNYIGYFFAVKKEIFDKVGGFKKDYNKSYKYDFILRSTELTNKIYHISSVLNHLMQEYSDCEQNNISNNIKILEDTLERRKIKGKVTPINNRPFCFIDYQNDNELVSIILLTRDHVEYLSKCVDSIYAKTTYKNFELIIVDHCTQQEEALNYMEKIKKEHDNIKIIKKDGEFNYSYLNNEGIKLAKGKYLLLLNSDTEIITPNWIELMLGYARQKQVGCVGAKMYYDDGTIQHSGVIVGLGGVAGHVFCRYRKGDIDYGGRQYAVYDYGAVTFACVMINKEKYFEVNCLDNGIKCAFNDVDFCLKILDKGYYNVVVPQVELYHYESKIRGLDVSGEKYKRLLRESKFMMDKWQDKLKNDKFYNKNLSLYVGFHLDIY